MHTPVVPQMPRWGSRCPSNTGGRCPFSVSMDVVKDIMLVPPLRVASPKAPGTVVENGQCSGRCRQGSSCSKIAAAVSKNRSGGEKGEYPSCHSNQGWFFHFTLLPFLFSADIDPSYMIEITAFDDKLRVSIGEMVVESLLAILSKTSHCSCSSR
jgi:hypothetical protein